MSKTFFHIFTADSVNENNEFVAGIAGNDIGVAEFAEKAFCNEAKNVIADGMAESIVDGFKIVDVDENNGSGGNLAVFKAGGNFAFEEFAVIKTGEGVAVSFFLPMFNFFFPDSLVNKGSGNNGAYAGLVRSSVNFSATLRSANTGSFRSEYTRACAWQ